MEDEKRTEGYHHYRPNYNNNLSQEKLREILSSPYEKKTKDELMIALGTAETPSETPLSAGQRRERLRLRKQMILLNLLSMINNQKSIEYKYVSNKTTIKTGKFWDAVRTAHDYYGFAKCRNENHSQESGITIPLSYQRLKEACIEGVGSQDNRNWGLSGNFMKSLLLEVEKLQRRLTIQEAKGLYEKYLQHEEIRQLRELRSMMDNATIINYSYSDKYGKEHTHSTTFNQALTKPTQYNGFAKKWNRDFGEQLPLGYKAILSVCIDCSIEYHKNFAASALFIQSLIARSKELQRKLTIEEADKLYAAFLQSGKMLKNEKRRTLGALLENEEKFTYQYVYQKDGKKMTKTSTFIDLLPKEQQYKEFAAFWNNTYAAVGLSEKLTISYGGILGICIEDLSLRQRKRAMQGEFILTIIRKSAELQRMLTLEEAIQLEENYISQKQEKK